MYLSHWISALRRGEVIAYPTEAVFGLGCMADNRAATERILKLKKRPLEKGLIVITDRIDRIQHWFDDQLSAAQWQWIKESWPGAVTWIIPCTDACPSWVRGSHCTVAVRIPGLPLARELCRRVESALISTSANPQGAKPAKTAAEVKQYFADRIKYIVPQPTGGLYAVSEIREALTGRILRTGVAA